MRVPMVRVGAVRDELKTSIEAHIRRVYLSFVDQPSGPDDQ